MGVKNEAIQYLVDPELIVPSEEYEADEDFWERMCRVPEFRPYVTIGAYSRSAFDFFIDERLDAVYEEVDAFLAEPDVWNLYSLMSQLPNSEEANGDRNAILDETIYRPKYGSLDNRYAMQCDLCDSKTQLILTDAGVWNIDELAAHENLRGIIIARIDADRRECVRSAIRMSPSYAALQEYAHIAFPKLVFCDETWSTTRKLVGEEWENARIMADYFAVLNDSALTVWSDYDNNHARISRMSGLGLDCSPENGETDNNNKRVAERRFWLGDECFEMNWHAKLYRNRNRIYFVVDNANERVVIGGLTEHFDTR